MSSRCFKAVWPSCLSACLMLVGGSLHAQSTGASASGAASAAGTDLKAQQLSDVERAKRDADKVFQWIKFHAEKGETKKVEKPDKPEKHEAKAEPRPEPKPQPAVAKAPAPVRKAEPETDTKALAAAAPVDAPRVDPMASAVSRATPMASAPVPAAAPAFTGRVPEVMGMSAPSSMPAVGTPPPPQNEPEPVALPEEEAPLRLISKVDPEYPRAMLTQQRNGSVMVKFTVLTDGSVDAVEATKSPDRKLSAAAVTAVKQWRFAPLTKPRSVSVEIGFQME